MTKVVTLANMPASYSDVSVDLLDQTKLELQDSQTFANGDILATYILNDGSQEYTTKVEVRVSYDAKRGVTKNSIRLTTNEVVTESSVELSNSPAEVQLSWALPGPQYDTRAVMRMIGSAYSLAFNGVTTKVPNLGILDAITRGLVANLYG